jgi:DNA-binding PadR family transcriptional regulator
MRSPVNWALLGLVIQRPSYGYELIQRFERTFADGLELSSPSQIYTALDTLARRGLIEEVSAPPERDIVRQPKPHYQATSAGIESYSGWLFAQLDDERRRCRLLAQQLVLLDSKGALEVLGRCEQACLKEASGLSAAGTQRACESSAAPEGPAALVQRLISEEDRLRVGARLAWIEYARRELIAPSRA